MGNKVVCCLVRTRSDRFDADTQNFHGAKQNASNPGPRQSYNYNPIQGPQQHSQQSQSHPTLTVTGSAGVRYEQYNNQSAAPAVGIRLDSTASRGGRSNRENGNAHSPDSLDFPQAIPDSLNSPADSSTGGFVVVQHISDRNPDDNENDPADNARLETLFLLKAQNEMRRSAMPLTYI